MIPCVIYFLHLLLTVAPLFLILYVGLFYTVCSKLINDNKEYAFVCN